MGTIGRVERFQVGNLGFVSVETSIPLRDVANEAVTRVDNEQRSSRRKGVLNLNAPLFTGIDVVGGTPLVVCGERDVVKVLGGGSVPSVLWLAETIVGVLCGNRVPTVTVLPPCTMHSRVGFAAHGLGPAGVGDAPVVCGLIVPRVMVLPLCTTHSKAEFEAQGPGLGSMMDKRD